MKMDNKFSILDDFWMQVLMLDRSAANVLYHLLGGKASHTVVQCRHRCNGWSRDNKYSEIISHEMLAKDQFNINHAMTIRFIDDLSELEDIKEHPLGDLWEYQEGGKNYFCRPVTHMLVYFVNDTLPEDKLVCRVGYLLIADDLDINVELPTQIISTEEDNGSELANLVQYLKCPMSHRTEYGALADRVDALLNAWETRSRKAEE
jgi:hypothetical protein